MTASDVSAPDGSGIRVYRLGDLCRLLEVSERHARYVCERGILPHGMAREPGSGNHRDLHAGQAFWLGIVLKLKAVGLRTKAATDIAEWATRVKGMTKNLVWDHGFSPFDGALESEHRWYLDVGDLRYVRFATDANPSKHDIVHEETWVDGKSRRLAPTAAPVVWIRVDLTALARLLREGGR